MARWPTATWDQRNPASRRLSKTQTPINGLTPEDLERIRLEQSDVNREAIRKGAQENPAKLAPRVVHSASHKSARAAGASGLEPQLLEVYSDQELPRSQMSAPQKSFAGGVSGLALLWFATLSGAVNQVQLVKGLLLAGSLFVVYGESNSGKTFFLLDLALAIASGNHWCGRRVTKGLVLYVAGEGVASVRNRVAAYRQAHPDIGAAFAFAIIPAAVNLLDARAVQSLIATIRTAERESGERLVLIIVDTLARSLTGGDENSAGDMGNLINSADLIRNETGAALGFVHHTGKDAAKGARGHSSLRAAVDTEILVEGQSSTRTATVTKQRDLPADLRVAFDLPPIEIGRDEENEPITSCTVRFVDAPALSKAKAGGVNQQRAVAGLKEWARSHFDDSSITSVDIRGLLKAQKLDDRRRPEVLKYLVDIRVLTPAVGGYMIDRGML